MAWIDEDQMSQNQTSWVVIVGLVLVAAAGCEASTGTKKADAKFTRDIDTQVDAVMKDFKNE
jgi:hypothetical protein